MSEDIEDAMVVEGRSGIRKLRQLSADVAEIHDIYVTYSGDTVSFHSGGPDSLNRISASISGASAEVRPPGGAAAW
jgi:hypothetical protein